MRSATIRTRKSKVFNSNSSSLKHSKKPKKMKNIANTFISRHSLLLTATLFVALLSQIGQSLASENNPQVLMKTSAGDILIELDPVAAPKSVENFLEYVKTEFYNGTIFHRVIDGFMIQGGGFTADYGRKDTRAPIKNEANNGLKNQRYTIAMARTNAPHSATAQFFINTEDNNSLDHTGTTARGWGYAVFGRVVDGIDVVKTISTTVTGPGGPFSRDAPQETIMIEKAVVMPDTEAIESGTDSSQ